MSTNPFDLYDLDPSSSIEELTDRLRERLAGATGAETERVRAAWEELTLHARARTIAALTTFFDDAPPAEAPPAPERQAAPAVAPHVALPFVRRIDACPPAPSSVLDPSGSVTADPLLEEGPP